MKKLPLGIQSFREIVEEGHVYVDKTKFIYDIIKNGKCFFLSRPRRFGKSLLLDTIAEVLTGNKDLFKELWIYDSDYNFASHPVVRLDMSNVETRSPDSFSNSLMSRLLDQLEDEGIAYRINTPTDLFYNLVRGLHKKYNQRVVVLIDEYDKPILDHLTKIEIAEVNREILRSFYGILKSLDSCLKFTFFTGVSKFMKASVFSSLNNLHDITMDKQFANICGVPVDDLEHYFGDRINNLANHEDHMTYLDIRDRILAWYDGYTWDTETKLLNPYGLLSFFRSKEFKSYWYVSGSPKFLIDLILAKPEDVPKLQNITISEADMDFINIQSLGIGPLLFQTGYLTVSKIIRFQYQSPEYQLNIPNKEVRETFFRHLTSGLLGRDYDFATEKYRLIHKALYTGDLQCILDMLRSLFAAIPYQLHVNAEAYYHSIFFSIMTVLGFDIDAEVSTSRGRIDASLVLPDRVYVFEFKYVACSPDANENEKRKLTDKALKQGMMQIADRGYADKFAGRGKTIYQAVFAFLGRDNVEMESLISH